MERSRLDNARIAKNTILLYVRMIVTLILNLYISRTLLALLGQEDYGIYNVVGGVVVLLSFLTNAMTNSTQRFLNYSVGAGDSERNNLVFSNAMIAHYTILLIVFILLETVGLWFFETQLNIPCNRMGAARWVYQFTIITTLFNIIVIPYRSTLIATEDMGIFAGLSIVEVITRLIIVIVLSYFFMDNLIWYTILLTIGTILIFFLYRQICRRRVAFSKFRYLFDVKLYRELMSFSTWYLFGGLANVGSKQGINILINIFHGVTVNAAMGVASQVRSAVFGFVSNFQTAFNPQLVKLYAAGEMDNLRSLIYRSSKFSYYLLIIMSIPIIVYCDKILDLWLTEVPLYAVVFTQLVIICSFFEALSAPLWTTIGATGKVKHYQIFVSSILILNIPLSYVALKAALPVWVVYIVDILINLCAYLFRLFYVRMFVDYSITKYMNIVLLPCSIITLLSLPIPLFCKSISESWLITVAGVIATVIVTIILIYTIGLDKSEKAFINSTIRQKLQLNN